jgi:uncharacterized protein involved in exopolysaccharide biosynthesis
VAIVACALLGAAIFGVRAWFATPIYRSEAIVGIAEDASSGMRGLIDSSGLGAIASLAGVNIGRGQDRRAEYVALLTSKGLIRDFILARDLLPVLFASRWDPEKKAWRASMWRDGPPPIDDGVEKFRRDVLNVLEDQKTGLVTVQIDWKDRELAAQWVTDLIGEVNDQVRHSAVSEAQSSIDFLYKELDESSAVGVREAIYRLIEADLGKVVIANTQRQYALKVIDPPLVSDARRYVRPKLALETILGAAAGCFGGLALVLWVYRRSWLPNLTR